MNELITNSNIYTVDAHYIEPGVASIHLIRNNNRITIVDTGTQYSVPHIETALAELSLNWLSVDYIILTHIHLDHAGGASTLMQLCPNAKLVCHPKGARHMVEPAKLIAGTMAVYGKEAYQKTYGEIHPIDSKRIIQPADNDVIQFNNRPLRFIDTPGHANHHFCIIDEQTNSIFTGDTLGIGYTALRDSNQAFVFPTTTPVQFNPDALHQSIDHVMSYHPNTLYLTHYSALKPTTQIIAGLHEQIDDFVMLTQQAADNDSETMSQRLEQSITDYLVQRCSNQISTLDEKTIRQWLTMDAKLNTQGLLYWWDDKQAAIN